MIQNNLDSNVAEDPIILLFTEVGEGGEKLGKYEKFLHALKC